MPSPAEESVKGLVGKCGGEDRADKSDEAGLSGGQGRGKACLSDVSHHRDHGPPWPVSCPQAGDVGRGHRAARPPKPLAELIIPAPGFLQGAACHCFIQVRFIFNLLPNEQM